MTFEFCKPTSQKRDVGHPVRSLIGAWATCRKVEGGTRLGRFVGDGWVHALVAGDELPAELLGEVFEAGVGGADEVELLFASPTFELLFAGDGEADVSEAFEVQEAGAGVGFGEAFEGAGAVLEDAGVDVAGDADVEGAREAAHDVGVSGWHGADASRLRC